VTTSRPSGSRSPCAIPRSSGLFHAPHGVLLDHGIHHGDAEGRVRKPRPAPLSHDPQNLPHRRGDHPHALGRGHRVDLLIGRPLDRRGAETAGDDLLETPRIPRTAAEALPSTTNRPPHRSTARPSVPYADQIPTPNQTQSSSTRPRHIRPSWSTWPPRRRHSPPGTPWFWPDRTPRPAAVPHVRPMGNRLEFSWPEARRR
jgi:hypothetical protein